MIRNYLTGSVSLYFVLFLSLFWTQILRAQNPGTPAFYNNTSTFENAHPLNGSTNKIQCVYGPNLFNSAGSTGTPAGKGNIKAVYIRMGVMFNSSLNYSDFTVKLAQNVGVRDTFANTTWNTSMSTVFYQSSFTITGSQGDWIKIPLQTVFPYDPSKSLVVELAVSSGNGGNVRVDVSNKKNKIYGTYSGTSGTGFHSALLNFGLDIEALKLNNAGIKNLVQPINFCAGTHNVKVAVVNNGARKIDSVRVNWMLDDTLKSTIFVKTQIDTVNSSNGNVLNVSLGNVNFPSGLTRKLKIWTSYPNGVIDSSNNDDTIQMLMKAALNGVVRVGVNQSKYKTLSQLATDLNNYGVCGPVKVLIDSATYNERVVLDNIGGLSKINNLQFIGEGTQKTIIEHKGSNTSDWQTILLSNCHYISFKHLGVKVLDSVIGIGFHFVGSSNNLIDSCEINMRNNSWSFRLFGICGSGTKIEATPGNSGDSNTFSNLTINGGYYGIYYSGGGSWGHNYKIHLINNQIKNYLRNGIWLFSLSEALIKNNVIESQRMADVNGVTLSTLNNFKCIGNRVYSVREGLYIDNCNFYFKKDTLRSLMANNVIINTGTFWPASEIKYCKYIDFVHNSVNGQAALLFRVISTDSSKIQNNIFRDTTKGVFFDVSNSTFSGQYTINNNVYYFPNATVPVSYLGTSYSSVGAWFSAVPTINQGSLSQDPVYKSFQDLHLVPGNRPTGVYAGVVDDYDGVKRCGNNPTIGAFELVKGSVPNRTNPIYTCAFDTFKIQINPPSGLHDSDYLKKWDISDLSFKTSYGFKPSFYSVNPPSKNTKVYIQMITDANDIDSVYELRYILEDYRDHGCYTTYGDVVKVNRRPVASISATPTQICLGDSISFTNNSSHSSIIQWLWAMDNGEFLTQKSFKYLYKTGGVFQVRFRAITGGCSDTQSLSILVNDPKGSRYIKSNPYQGDIRTGTVNQPDLSCIGDTLTYELMPPNGMSNAHYNKLWSFDQVSLKTLNGVAVNGLWTWPADSFNNYKIQFVSNASNQGDTLLLYAKVKSLSINNCDSSINRYIYVAPQPQVNFDYSVACLNSKPVTFNNLSTNSNGSLSYEWYFGDAATSAQTHPNHSYLDTGQFNVKLIVRNNFGCMDSLSKALTVHSKPKAAFVAIGKCLSDTISFSDSSSVQNAQIVQHKWAFGNGVLSNLKNPKHHYSIANNYSVKLKVEANTGCVDSIVKTVVVYSNPQPDFNVFDVCVGDTSVFIYTTQSNSNQTFKWNFGDNTLTNLKSPKHVYKNAGTYTVQLQVKDTSTSCTGEYQSTTQVFELPLALFDIIKTGNRTRRFIPHDSAGNSLTWYFGDGDTSIVVSPSHTYPNKDETYTVQLKLISSNGCVNTYEDTLSIFYTSLNSLNSPLLQLKVYPNPAQQHLFVEAQQETAFQITSLKGELLMNGTFKVGENDLDVSTLQSGVYYLNTENLKIKVVLIQGD